ncbi:MAG: RDD family protein [Oleiphilaceae bacterium]|nr:RDD family protein [Oleiphilaceae bacterium]
MPRRFHDQEEILPPASLLKRLLAMLYDGLICIAVLLVITWAYTLLAAWTIGFDQYQALAEGGKLNTDPLLTLVLLVSLYLFFGYFWTRSGQTLGMQVWRIRVENNNGTSISWLQALLRFMMSWVSWLAAGLGYWWMLFDPQRATWHDRFSESRVVSVPKD